MALDQATTTGWSIVDGNGNLIRSGTFCTADKKRTGESRGMRYIRFQKKIEDIINEWHPDMVCHEQTLLRGGAATELANGFKAIILKVCAERNIEVSCVHTTELKKWATGDGKADKRVMMRTSQSLTSCVPSDDNEADATLIGLWASEKYGNYHKPENPEEKREPKKPKRRRVVINWDEI